MKLVVVAVLHNIIHNIIIISDSFFPNRIPDLPLDDKPSTEHQSEVSCIALDTCTIYMYRYVHVRIICLNPESEYPTILKNTLLSILVAFPDISKTKASPNSN